MPAGDKISVILPAYNEKASILPLIDAVHSRLSAYSHEILVVDDNSPDGTYRAVLGLNRPYVKAILRTANRSLAGSIRCGLENAEGQIILVMDSDFNHQPEYLSFMVESLSDYDCVIASRFICGGKAGSRLHHALSRIFNQFVCLATGLEITDSLYGFFAVKRRIIQRLVYDDIFWGYGDYFMRLLYYLQKSNASIRQFPALNGERKGGRSKSNFITVFCRYFAAVLKLACKGRIKVNVPEN